LGVALADRWLDTLVSLGGIALIVADMVFKPFA
jgi:hypothetical protein